MEQQIIQKVRMELSTSIDTEAKVVYTLVEIRKHLDHTRDPKFQNLPTYCNWAVHTKLDRLRPGNLLEVLDQEIGSFTSWETFDKEMKVHSILSFKLLGRQLAKFFIRHSLPTSLVDDRERWRQFCLLYVGVVSVCPLVYTPANPGLRYLRQATVTHCEPSEAVVKANPHTEWVAWNWELIRNDGKALNMPFHDGYGRGIVAS